MADTDIDGIAIVLPFSCRRLHLEFAVRNVLPECGFGFLREKRMMVVAAMAAISVSVFIWFVLVVVVLDEVSSARV